MKILVSTLAAGFIATVGAGSAQAAVRSLDFSAVALCPASCTGISYAGATLGTSSAIDLDGSSWIVVSVNTGDQSGLQAGNPFSLTPHSGTYGSLNGIVDFPLPFDIIKQWTATIGPDAGQTVTETLTSLHEVVRGINAIAFTFEGTVSGGVFNNEPVDMVLSLTQAGGPGNVVSASLTNFGTTPIPELSTWAMMGLGFIGLGYAAVRRSSKGRSVPAV
jgi:hypothetical protein